MYRSRIKGIGSYLPKETITNKDLEKIVDTTDEWIWTRTGIRTRYKVSPGECCSDLGVQAARGAMKEAGISPKDIEMTLFATTSPDHIMPNTACLVKEKLELPKKGMALDLYAACSGFVYTLSIADQFIRTGVCENILIIGSEVLTPFVNYKDRSSCILFGDGAGSVILGRAHKDEDSQIFGHYLYADGGLSDLITYPSGGSKIPLSQEVLDKDLNKIQMKGREVFKNAVLTMKHCCEEVLKEQKMTLKDVDWVVPHQANIRILESLAQQLHVDMSKVIVEIENMGNTSSATIPLSLNRALQKKQIQRGQNLLLTAFGGGLTSGSLLLKY